MIKLINCGKETVRCHLEENGTREKIIKSVMKTIGKKQLSFGDDKSRKFTIVKVGKSYGVAKRCTYWQEDEPRLCIGFTLALLRALGLKDE